ncbi:MAG: CvpA family protein [Thiotrichaceae bacterium]
MDSINYIDIGIVVLILLSAVVGFVRGFVREAFSLTTWVVAGFAAFLFYKKLAAELPFNIPHELARDAVSVLLIVIGVFIIGALINYLFGKAVHIAGLGSTDRVLGGAFGVLRGAFVVTLIVLLMRLGLTSFTDGDLWKGSKLVPHFVNASEWIKKETPDNTANMFKSWGVKLGIDDSAADTNASEKAEEVIK